MSQTERILFIDRTLRTHGTFTVKDVVKKFEISIRQVKRDIEYMRDRFEAPIEWNAAKHAYIYGEKFKRLEFADQHLILAYLSMQSMLKNASYFPAVSDELLASFTSQIPKDYLEICDKILYQVPVAENLDPQFFASICSSMRDKLCLEIEYTDSKNETTSRKIEPYYLINYGGNWYMVCYDYFRENLRTFNIARISNLKITKDIYLNHGNDFNQAVLKYVEGGFGIFLGERLHEVKIKFFAQGAAIVRSQSWHPKQQIEVLRENDIECVVLSFPAANMTEVLSKILSFGVNAIPLEPAELKQMWKEEIKKMKEIASRM